MIAYDDTGRRPDGLAFSKVQLRQQGATVPVVLRLLVVLGVIGAAAWWWWEPGRDHAPRVRTSQPEGVAATGPEEEEVEPDGDPSGFIDGDGWTAQRLSVVEVVGPDGQPVEGALVVGFDFDLETASDRRIA
ncbi:MAG: hypothetical protein ACE5JG_10630, partial [Planctomycetota bacterium]